MDKSRKVKVYFDKEADYIEILFEIKEGFFMETDNDFIMKKVDKDGNVIGFSIQNLSNLETNPLSLFLQPAA
ncbi:MAG: DUF2283 domain-containing protein [Leptospiraceae bacterium]|nr:DUF2283 domain-containing protein [Leptospiraceae bacterium]